MSATTTPKAEAGGHRKRPAQSEMISGGHLVAKALKAEGIDVIYTLCGGHIIDIYDGCVDEGIKVIDVRHEQVAAHAADAYARVTGKPGCAVVTAGPGTTDAVTGVANALRAESPFLLIGGQGALNQHKMGSLQDLPARRHDEADHEVRLDRRDDGARRRHGARWRSARRWPARRARRSSRSAATSSTTRCRSRARSSRASPAATARRRRASATPTTSTASTDILVNAERPCVLLGTQVWTSRGHEQAIEFARELNIPAYMNGAAPRHAAARRPAPLPPHAPLRVQQRRRDRHRRHAVRLPDGLRQAPVARGATVVQIDMDYRTVGKNRDIVARPRRRRRARSSTRSPRPPRAAPTARRSARAGSTSCAPRSSA